MIQTREPVLYDSIKILLVKENIVEIEVFSVIQPSRKTALRLHKILLVEENIVELEVCSVILH